MGAPDDVDPPDAAPPGPAPDGATGGLTLSNGVELAQIGARVRAVRSRRGLSLDELAGRSGVSRSMVSEIERGRKVPTIVVLDRVANALGTSLARLVQPEDATRVVIRRAADQQVAVDPAGWERRILSPVLPGVEFELMRTTIGPGVDAGTWRSHGPGSREYLAVESGTLVLTVDGIDHELGPGDSVFHDGDCDHGYRNTGNVACTYYLALDLCDVDGAATVHR
ncbi:MAG: XRE family transcriptional regulator [Actinomycetota bacterium]|nr:XRE family transcriptional regulator [Actinomycetota bacterium]